MINSHKIVFIFLTNADIITTLYFNDLHCI